MATRRSARAPQSKISYDEDIYIDEDDPEEYIPQKKKPKTNKSNTRKKLRGKRGLLSQLTEFPLDVLFEVTP